MRQQPSGRRPRGRSNRKHFVPHRSQNYDSHGPDVRVRGNAMQVYEKYVSLARDAFSSGDRIAAESYQQYAEHYYRIINDTTDPQRPVPQSVTAERGFADASEVEQDQAERGGGERQRDARQPYPVDAEQPFVDRGSKVGVPAAESAGQSGERTDGESAGRTDGESAGQSSGEPARRPAARPLGRSMRASAGNGQAPEAEAVAEEAASPADAGDGAPSETSGTAKASPRGRTRPRTRAKAGNGAASEEKSEEAAGPASGDPDEAGSASS